MSAEDIEYMGDYKEFPTKESALDWLDNYLSLDERNNLIRALQQEPVLDKIRAEIKKLDVYYDNDYFVGNRDAMFKCNEVLHILDKYHTETEVEE